MTPLCHSWPDSRVRWYMLGLFLWLTTNQCLCWFTFSTASTPGVSEYYGFSTENGDAEIDLDWTGNGRPHHAPVVAWTVC